MVETTFIYGLNDPETGECRYVGKSNNPHERLSDHFTECRDKTHRRANWLNSLAAKGLKPTLQIIDEVPFEHWKQLEVAYIEFFRERGFDLTNGTPGGEDPPSAPMLGKIHSLEARAKIRASLKALPIKSYANRRIKRIQNSSRFHGVIYYMARKNWRASICVSSKRIFLGYFDDELSAAKVHDSAAKTYHGEGAKLNFPNE